MLKFTALLSDSFRQSTSLTNSRHKTNRSFQVSKPPQNLNKSFQNYKQNSKAVKQSKNLQSLKINLPTRSISSSIQEKLEKRVKKYEVPAEKEEKMKNDFRQMRQKRQQAKFNKYKKSLRMKTQLTVRKDKDLNCLHNIQNIQKKIHETLYTIDF